MTRLLCQKYRELLGFPETRLVTQRCSYLIMLWLVLWLALCWRSLGYGGGRALCGQMGCRKSLVIAANVAEFGDEESSPVASPLTDEAAKKTHGYEGDFRIGDTVRVKSSCKIYSVKQFADQGFDPKGFEGVVSALVLYGRKYKSLCSAITPVKVEFQPTSNGIPVGMFDRKWIAHFAGDELELIKRV